MKGYPSGFKAVLLATLALILVTGLLLTPTTLVLRLDWDLPWRLPGEARIAAAALHAALGFLTLMLVGALWTGHMRSGWRRRRHLVSGVIVTGGLVLLMLTAVGVYYLGDEGLGTVAAFTHLLIGLALTAPFGWHWWQGHRQAKSHRRAAGPGGSAPVRHRPKLRPRSRQKP